MRAFCSRVELLPVSHTENLPGHARERAGMEIKVDILRWNKIICSQLNIQKFFHHLCKKNPNYISQTH